jgi:SOS-response transcriptional repressor LexA
VKYTPTKKQKDLLDYLVRYIRKHGIAPTVQEMADYRSVSVPGAVQMLQQLERRGLISRLKNTPGAISIVGMDLIKVEDEEDVTSMLNS